MRLINTWEARIWSAAVAAYGAGRGRSLLFDTGLVSVRDWAAGVAGSAAVPSADRPMAAAVEAALPVYVRRWWPEHDRRNRAWIASVSPLLDDVEELVIPGLEAAYGGMWPAGRIPVDVMVHANDVGAYSVGGRVTISSGNRNIVMPHAVDLLFHEASHVDALEAPALVVLDVIASDNQFTCKRHDPALVGHEIATPKPFTARQADDNLDVG